MNLFKIEVVYILLLGFSSLPLSSVQEILFVFDGKKKEVFYSLVRQKTHDSHQICYPLIL